MRQTECTAGPAMTAKKVLTSLRLLAAGLALCALGGCSSDPGSGWSQVVDLAKASFNRPDSVSLQQAASVPYASIGVRIGDGQQAMLVLASDSGQTQLWTSKAHIAISTRAGRVIETAGLPKNLSATVFAGLSDPLPEFLRQAVATPVSEIRNVDFSDLSKYSVLIRCRLAGGNPARVVILGHAILTRHFEEHCESSELDWSFTNSFWADRAGFIWKSIQHIHPKSDPLEIEVLRPPG